ncbi:MAG: transporter [Pedosphaera sp.]|nr:transporter [Pedosphaera sp.]
MQINRRRFIPTICLGAVIALMTLTGCHTGGDRTVGRRIDDATLTHRVKHALNREPIYKFPDVKVETLDGVVQLSGFVDTPEQKARAAEVAQRVEGVRQVINNITLKPRGAAAPTGSPTGRNYNQRKFASGQLRQPST